jgi:capsular polysaccharide biosynthesis protein
MLTWHDIFYYVKLFLRWWFVLVLAVLLAAGTAWYVVRQQPNMYTSQVTLSVGTNFSVAAPDQAQVALSNVLADYYAALSKREVILGPVVEELELSFPWTLIRDRMLATRVDRGANLLEVRITDTNPERAAAIANAISNSLIAFTPNSPEKIEAQQSEINRQLQDAQRNLQAVESRIAELQGRLSTLSSAIDIADIQSQLQILQATREQYLGNYSNLVGLSNQTLANSLSVFEAAIPSPYALPKKTQLSMAMAGAGGLLLALVAVLVLDMLDERWRTGNELQSRTKVKSLGEVPLTPPAAVTAPAFVARREQAVSTVYANLVLAARSRLPRSLLISSTKASAARSAVAIDLASMYVRTGHRVILVDAEDGSSHLVDHLHAIAIQMEQSGWRPAAHPHMPGGDGAAGMLAHLKPTALHNVLLLSGRSAGHERLSTLVPLAYWPEMVEHLRKVADVVIFDGPSALNGPDAGILAPLVDGSVLVLDGREDSRSTVLKARKFLGTELHQSFLGAIVLGRAPAGALVRNAPPAARGTPQAQPQPAYGRKVRFAIDRNGITITLGSPRQAQPVAAAATAAPAPATLLLRAPEQAEQLETDPQEAEVLSWDDLVRMGQQQPVERTAAVMETPAGDDTFVRPHPVTGDLNTAASTTAERAAPVAQPRRARIAGSQRAPRARGTRLRSREVGYE